MHDCALGVLVFFQVLHKCGIWLSRAEAQKAVDSCNMFCSGYSFLAAEFHQMGLPRYHIEPSLHQFKHASVRMQQQLRHGFAWVLSPGVFLNENGEGFIGQVARVSRRVAAKTCGLRTLQRFLIKAHLTWTRK